MLQAIKKKGREGERKEARKEGREGKRKGRREGKWNFSFKKEKVCGKVGHIHLPPEASTFSTHVTDPK